MAQNLGLRCVLVPAPSVQGVLNTSRNQNKDVYAPLYVQVRQHPPRAAAYGIGRGCGRGCGPRCHAIGPRAARRRGGLAARTAGGPAVPAVPGDTAHLADGV